MSAKVAELFEELDRQKRKYHEKELSIDAELSLLFRSFQIYDFMLDIANFLIPEFNFSSLISSVLFDVSLFDLEPFNLEFDWRMPTLDEWLRGVSIVFEKTTPWCATGVEEFIEKNIEPEYAATIQETRVEKGYYGISRYGQCYYDPTAAREIIKTTFLTFFKKHAPFATRRKAIEEAAKALNINLEIVKSVYNRISMIVSAHTECFVLGYGLLGKSKLCASVTHSPQFGVVPFIDFDGNYREAMVTNLSQIQWGFILGVSALGYGVLAPAEDMYMNPPTEVAPGVFEPGSPEIVKCICEKVDRFRRRAMLTPLAFTNYVTGDEAADYTKCERTEVWGELMATRYSIELEIDGLLRNTMPYLDPFERRKYISAALQLLGHRAKRHEWGYKPFEAMTDEEFKNWWIGLWQAQGLKPEILNTIYETVKTWLPQLLRKKLELGQRLRLQRLLLQAP